MAICKILVVAAFAAITLISCVSGSPANITSPPDTDWGVWGIMDRCPGGRFAQAFQLKTQPNQWTKDDTALNAIRLYCGDPTRPDTALINSTEGDFGAWGKVYSCFPSILIGFQLRVESYADVGDDTATNNIRFFCSNQSNPNAFIEGDGLSWGTWRTPLHCNSEQGICGIQTQVEPDQGDGDDTALNRVNMECCDFGLPSAPEVETATFVG